MTDTTKHIREAREKIAKLEKDFRHGKNFNQFTAFTLNVSYEGNRHVDIERVSIGGIGDDENVGKLFYDLMLKSLKNSLKFWEGVAEREIKELQKALNNE